MRTSIELPDELFREIKVVAAQRGVSLKEVIRTAVENELTKSTVSHARRVKFPILDSQEPGTLSLTNAEIEDLLT